MKRTEFRLASSEEEWYESIRGSMDFPADKCLHELFQLQAIKTPFNTAVVYKDQSFTFSQLDQLTDVLAEHLKRQGVERNKIVGIYMERCAEYVIAYLAILKAGGGYMPIELAYPPDLLQRVIQDASPVLVLTKTNFLPDMSFAKTFCLDEGWIEFVDASPSVSWKSPSPDSLAYVVYSSGTTGLPKGICCPHIGAVHSYHWRHIHYPFEKGDRVASNVFLVWEVVRPLLKGFPVYIIPDDVIYDPPQLIRFLSEHSITRILLTPSLAQYCLDVENLVERADLSKLRILVLCGEVVSVELRNRLIKAIHSPRLQIPNLYSIAECHDISCVDIAQYSFGGTEFSSCGTIFPNVSVFIMNEQLDLVHTNEPGEVFVGGPTLAIGYLNQPEMTNAKFIHWKHPKTHKTQRLYRTGDRGILRNDGHLEILGRCDSVVKIRGYTVSLDAIEAAMEDFEYVHSAVAKAIGKEGGHKQLLGYVVLSSENNFEFETFRRFLKSRLPSYSIPSIFIRLNELPINVNSAKCDRKKLPLPEDLDPVFILGKRSIVALNTSTEHSVAEIWKQVLGIDEISALDDFFALGGHSLSASQCINAMKSQERWKDHKGVSIKLLLEVPVLSQFASIIDRITEGEDHNSAPIDFQRESQLDLDPAEIGMLSRSHDGILVTGANGFVGAFLLHEIMQSNPQCKVFALVRGLSIQDAKIRLEKAFDSFSLQMSSDFTVIAGDLAIPNLGLSKSNFLHLASQVSTVYHCGAHVNLIYPYSALKSPNVLGTREMVRLCALTHPPAKMHYISTLAVIPKMTSTFKETLLPVEAARDLQHGYSQSKLIGELLVKQWNGPSSIYRLGNIAWSSDTAAWNHFDYETLFLAACVLLKRFPDPKVLKWSIDFTPVDICARAIARTSLENNNDVVHIVNRNSVSYAKVLDVLLAIVEGSVVLSWDDWKAEVKHRKNSLELLVSLWSILESSTPADFANETLGQYETSVFEDHLPETFSSGRFLSGYLTKFVHALNDEFQINFD